MADASILKAYADAGYTLTPLKGKVPIKKDWTKTQYSSDPDPRDFPENFGVVLQDVDLVIDCDPRNYKDGINSFQKLQNDIGWSIKNTSIPVVRTGGGGLHVYLKKPADLEIFVTCPKYPGVEFKTKGTQVVGARCRHPETKMFYNIVNGEFKSGTHESAPQALLEIIKKVKTPREDKKVALLSEDAQTVLRYTEYLKTVQPAIQGQSGDKTTFTVACHGRDLGIGEDLTFTLMIHHYNPRCNPPWTPDELRKKVSNAFEYAQNSQGNLNPKSDFPDELEKPSSVPVHWDLNERGARQKTLNNCVNYFLLPESPLYNIVAWDQFTDQVMLIGHAPWHPETERIPTDGLPWTDEDTTLCRYYLSKTKKFDISPMVVNEAISVIAKRHPNHPVRNFLNGLKWDGEMRLDKWLVDYCGVVDSKYVRAVGAKTLLGAVARVFQPGIKFDYMLVLEGEQGTGKSSIVSALGGPWYGDLIIDPHNKDTIAAMRGKWIVEASEMDFATKAEAQAQKAFLSRQVDVVRTAYARLTKAFYRQCIFIGTMNLEAEAGYLKDTTGNRRFWPVTTRDIQLPAFREVRDQLWAEATYRYKHGESLYLEDREVAKLAFEEQYARRIIDPWCDKISEWLDQDQFGEKKTVVTTMDIWTECLQGLEKQLDRRNQTRIVYIMNKELKWDRGIFYSPTVKKAVAGFRRPAFDPLVQKPELTKVETEEGTTGGLSLY